MNKPLTKFSILNLYLATVMLVAVEARAEPLHLLALELDKTFMPGKDFRYNRFINAMGEEGFSYDLTFTSIKRLWRGMSEDNTACTFPTDIESVVRISGYQFSRDQLIQSQPVDYVSYRALVRPGDPIIQTKEQLVGKKVAAWGGIPNAELVGVEGVEYIATNSEESRAQMLYSHRVDVVLGFVPGINIAIEELGYPQPETKGTLAVWIGKGEGENSTHLVCFDTPNNRQGIAQFDAALERIKARGELRGLLGPFADLGE